MPAYVEVWSTEGPELVPLEGDRFTVGKLASNEIAITGDGQVSRVHAAFERFAAGWCIRDLSSRNGTHVNGQRISGDRPLRPGDEIRLGRTRLVYREEESAGPFTATDTAEPPPELTRREREVLLALCQPVLTRDVFTEPASIKEIAKALVVTDAAVKQHLARLYDKFRIHEQTERRRVRLANEAIRRGAVSLADIHEQP